MTEGCKLEIVAQLLAVHCSRFSNYPCIMDEYFYHNKPAIPVTLNSYLWKLPAMNENEIDHCFCGYIRQKNHLIHSMLHRL